LRNNALFLTRGIRQVAVHKCDSYRAFVNQALSPLRWREASC
jgi:hypothetical protein